jgi:hypothetical protein
VKKSMRRLHRGDLSAPVLAIIVTVGIIAAGLVLMAWFWWFAPQAGKAGTLQILGTPSIVKETIGVTDYWVAYISVRNVGNEKITVIGVTVKGVSMDKYSDVISATTRGWILLPDNTYTNDLEPGQSGIIKAAVRAGTGAGQLNISDTEYAVPCVIQTNYGTFTVNLAVVR